jgi:predicted alpha/beta-fold hydrolase
MRHAHVSTIVPNSFRRVAGVRYRRERLELPDGDFLDLDWVGEEKGEEKGEGKKGKGNGSGHPFSLFPSPFSSPSPRPLALLTHGYLGSSTRQYMLGAARAFREAGYDVLAWNHRGLGGEPNRLEIMTTHGSTDDLSAVVDHALARGYRSVTLVGFSKGGNLALKYAGERGTALPAAIRSVLAVSVPCDLRGSWDACRGTFYGWYFRRKLDGFMQHRRALIPPERFRELARFRTLDDITNHYVAPLYGWRDWQEYCERCASLPYLPQIPVPALILNAQNDPVLSPGCSPVDLARTSDTLFVETPRYGGHCGFYEKAPDGLFWVERRLVAFAETYR